MAEKACVKRLQKEYRALCKEPVSNVVARPSPNDILEWHYVLEGSLGTPFAGGYYYGKIKFPPEYPYKPPGITMITPNGRFMPQRKICLSMSDFHPESWNPMWSVSSILTGLLSFMMDNSPTTGSVNTPAEEKQRLAKASLAFNCKNITFRRIFPEYMEKFNERHLAEQNNHIQLNNTDVIVHKDNKNAGTNFNRVDATAKDKRRIKKQSFPTWMVILLLSIFEAWVALGIIAEGKGKFRVEASIYPPQETCQQESPEIMQPTLVARSLHRSPTHWARRVIIQPLLDAVPMETVVASGKGEPTSVVVVAAEQII